MARKHQKTTPALSPWLDWMTRCEQRMGRSMKAHAVGHSLKMFLRKIRRSAAAL